MCCSTHGVDTGSGRTEGNFALQYTTPWAERCRLHGALVQRGQRRTSLQVSHHCYLRWVLFKIPALLSSSLDISADIRSSHFSFIVISCLQKKKRERKIYRSKNPNLIDIFELRTCFLQVFEVVVRNVCENKRDEEGRFSAIFTCGFANSREGWNGISLSRESPLPSFPSTTDSILVNIAAFMKRGESSWKEDQPQSIAIFFFFFFLGNASHRFTTIAHFFGLHLKFSLGIKIL